MAGGFTCPACGVCKGWELQTKSFTWECAGCHRQTSVTAGTVMHRSKLPLRTWFETIHLLTSHSNGISAEQAQAQLGIRSYKTAWLLLTKLRRAMVDPDRMLLRDLVEVDETEVAFRSKHDPIAKHGVSIDIS
jgi:transposase-like protein